jgi:hypothetical protein
MMMMASLINATILSVGPGSLLNGPDQGVIRKLRVLTSLVATMMLVGVTSAAWAADRRPNDNAANALAWLILLLTTFHHPVAHHHRQEVGRAEAG